jgi:hypothetical protein
MTPILKQVIGSVQSKKLNTLRVSDTFTRADGALGVTDTGHTWVTPAGSVPFVISGNKAVGGGVGNSYSFVDCGYSDVSVSADITFVTGDTGLGVVCRSPNNGGSTSVIYFRFDAQTRLLIRELINGASYFMTPMIPYTWANGATHNMKIIAVKSSYKIYMDDILIASVRRNNSLISNTYVGLFAYKGAAAIPLSSFSNFKVMTA